MVNIKWAQHVVHSTEHSSSLNSNIKITWRDYHRNNLSVSDRCWLLYFYFTFDKFIWAPPVSHYIHLIKIIRQLIILFTLSWPKCTLRKIICSFLRTITYFLFWLQYFLWVFAINAAGIDVAVISFVINSEMVIAWLPISVWEMLLSKSVHILFTSPSSYPMNYRSVQRNGNKNWNFFSCKITKNEDTLGKQVSSMRINWCHLKTHTLWKCLRKW